MGVKNIKKFIESNGYNFNNKINLSSLCDNGINRIAIDISQLIHRYHSNNYLISILKIFNKMKYNNISPIFVFDGKPPLAKKHVLDKRKKEKEKYINMINDYQINLTQIESIKEELSNIDYKKRKCVIESEIKKIKKRTFSIKKEHITNIKELFNLLQIPYIHLNYEADLICALLVKNNVVDACMSDDFDLLGFGCNVILRNYDFYKNTVSLVRLDDICEKLEITSDQLIYLIIFNGCDYSSKLNINLSYIHSLFKLNKTFDEIIALIINETYNYEEAYKLFTQNVPIIFEDINFYRLKDQKYRNIDLKQKDLYLSLKYDEDTIFNKACMKYISEYITQIHTIMPI